MSVIRRLLGRLSGLLARWSGEEVQVSRGLTLDGDPTDMRIHLKLDRMRTLRWTNLEAMRFKKRTGVDMWKGGITPLEWDIEVFMEFLAVACLQEDPEVTAEALAPFVAGEKITEVLAAVMVLISDWAPAMEGGGDANPLVASALQHLTPKRPGRSPRRPSASPAGSTGG